MIIYYSFPKDTEKEFKSESNSIIIGRKPLKGQSVDLDLREDEYVSHQHSRIFIENDKYWIEDMGSANGTWINDNKILGRTLLAASDRIRIGYTDITVFIETADQASEFECTPDINDPTLIRETESVTEISGFDEKTIVSDDTEPTEIGSLDEATIVSIHEEMPDYENTHDPATEKTEVDFSDSFQEIIIPDEKTFDDHPALPYSCLKAFNNFCSALENAKGFEDLAFIFSRELHFMIPNAQRGAILLSDEMYELHLKAHWPTESYTYSMNFCKKALDTCEALIWSDLNHHPNRNFLNSYYYEHNSPRHVEAHQGGL